MFSQCLRRAEFNRAVREAFAGAPLGGNFGAVAMVRLLVGLLVIGGRRLRHLAFAAGDPVFRRVCHMRVIPAARPVPRRLTAFTMTTVERLQRVHAAVIAQVAPGLRLRTITTDADDVVVSTGVQVERGFQGFSPPHGKAPSYYPILAHSAATAPVRRVRNRSGNVHDEKASLLFLCALWAQVAATTAAGQAVRFHMAGAFFRRAVLRWPEARGAG